MEFKQVSSLEKVRSGDELNYKEINSEAVLGGQRFSYQICARSTDDENRFFNVRAEGKMAQFTKIYRVKNAVMDMPATGINADDDYITHKAGLMPDVLIPIEECDNEWGISKAASSVWISVEIERGFKAGSYPLVIKIESAQPCEAEDFLSYELTMNIEALGIDMVPQQLIYTRWFYADCIADIHNVEPFSQEHWELIDKYIAAAAKVGINMILLPVHTPPLDTEIGRTRTCVQLVDIKYENGHYSFNFDKFKRFVDLCKKNKIKYYEMAHMFSQWGAKCTPNIKVFENGKSEYKFGWHVASDSEEYIEFLGEYIPAITAELRREGIEENTYFHISDEPSIDAVEAYMKAYNIIKPHIGESKTLDALSEFAFYEKGLVECPVTIVDHINDFLEHKIENQWVYYCCGPQDTYTNSFIAMPSCRTRIIGVQMYKYDIKGFLHWGFNFYNARRSHHMINPYLTTSADGAFPSGDPFIVYPGKNCVYGSIRGEVMFDALQDIAVCRTLESLVGRERVIGMIDSEADMDLKFDKYPKQQDFLPSLRQKMIQEIKENYK